MHFVNTKQEKIVKNIINISCIIWLIVLWRVLAFSPIRADSESYRLIYGASTNSYGTELGFYLLIRVARLLNQNYWTFRAECLGITFVILYIAIRRFQTNGIYFLFVYSFYPLLIDAIQYRFLLALSIQLLALSILESENQTRSTVIKYVAITIIASFIHTSVLVFLIYLLVVLTPKDKFRRIFIYALLLEMIIIILIRLFIPVFNNIIYLFRSTDLSIYQLGFDYFGWIKYVLIYALYLVISMLYMYEQYDQGTFEKYSHILMLSFVIINLTILNENLNRYFRSSIILTYFFIGKHKNRFTFNSSIYRIAILLCTIALYMKFINGDVLSYWKESFLGFSSFKDLLINSISFH